MRYANVTMTAECGTELVVKVPAGSMDPPTQLGRAAMEYVQDPTNWKLPTRELRCWNQEAAVEVAYAMDWYLGGHEMRIEIDAYGIPCYVESSRGYYHYIGA
jgi:hypothetical protein